MMGERILRHDSDGLATLTLNRPDKLNALDLPLFEELDAHVAALTRETDRIGCVVLGGAGRAFCAGADLGAIGKEVLDPRYKPAVLDRLAALPQPVVAAVHGVCFTGALELALACDLILADATARFADTHGKWGLVAGWGLIQRLPRKVGESTAKLMSLTGRIIGAAEAKQIGLIDLLAEEGGLDELVNGVTGEILANSWHTNFANKRMMLETSGMSLAEGLAYENYNYPGKAPDCQERIERFTKK